MELNELNANLDKNTQVLVNTLDIAVKASLGLSVMSMIPLTYILGMLNQMQLVVFLVFIPVPFPANSMSVYEILIEFVTFEILSEEQKVKFVLGPSEWLQEKFQGKSNLREVINDEEEEEDDDDEILYNIPEQV